MVYVDGYVLPVKKDKLRTYRKMASEAGKVWMKHGALQYAEAIGEDLRVPKMAKMILLFPKMVKPKKGETIFFSWILYKSRKHRDQVNAKVHKDMAKDMEKYKDMAMPFDCKRMAYGGFSSLVYYDKRRKK